MLSIQYVSDETVIIKKKTPKGIRFFPIQRDLAIECHKLFPGSYNEYTLGQVCLALSKPGLLGLKNGIKPGIEKELRIELSIPELAANEDGYLIKLLELLQKKVYAWILNGELVDSHNDGAKKHMAILETLTPFPANYGGVDGWWRIEVSIMSYGLQKISRTGVAYELLQVFEKIA